ncbi:A/G-specific adenine glycosylase [Granulicella tundricola]|uniref:Adenine DNA glycosylase n=1 Tax=Granulicella tundricola (strain ATCC BAA-1859 / DSM 23138 / MP5ACTX9) TaxID=1198114 RepID=E8WXD8_GRATM|nr:A/G-specific adenine glycosylase [Granulicella tundricola]ADW67471.1 HhH-GPD family protein [Granulicella tundricola MP5ACTX9]
MDVVGKDGLDSTHVLAFRRKLTHWYREHARELPWRGVHDPYKTWVSEVMLQQTRVAAVLEHYDRFLKLFPTIIALALAPEDEVLAAWSGLGYYRRARMLHKAAQFVVKELAGKIPGQSDELRKLPGVGEYTCAAIASIAFGESIAVVDGNVERVLLRVTGRAEEATAAGKAFIRVQAGLLVPHKRVAHHSNAAGDHNQGMMELGATVCLPRGPLCLGCPVYDLCATKGEHVTAPKGKQRSQTVAYLLETRKDGARTEVLLERRGDESSLMPGMLELPMLPLDAVEEREPILRVRHSITNTNYYVEIYTAPGMGDKKLRAAIPAARETLSWAGVGRLKELPLTGLARKVLMRMDLMGVAGPESPEMMRDEVRKALRE